MSHDVPDNFYKKTFLLEHIQSILAFYDPVVIASRVRNGGYGGLLVPPGDENLLGDVYDSFFTLGFFPGFSVRSRHIISGIRVDNTC